MSAREWLIKKGAYFYRPNKSGYTALKMEAGRYTKEDAEQGAAIEPWRMSAIHESEVPDPPMILSTGYRIIGPDELDPVTLERAAEHVEYTQLHDEQDNNIPAAAIRSLKKGGGGE